MKKKKLLVPLAVMTLSCGLCAGLLTGCGGHEHDYTQWAHDDTGHWQICVEDGETTDKEPHSWGADDKCECGAEKPAYGTASGNVKLLKMGEEVNEFAGVTIDPGEDDGIEIDYNAQTGAFTISNARVGKTYKLAISKDGYLTTYVNLQAVKNQNAALGDCTLSYDAFTHGYHTKNPNNPKDWEGNYGNPSKIDKTHVNDAENPYFKIGEGAGDFYVYSREEYDTVTAAVTYKQGDTNDITDLIDENPAPGNQGLRLVFEDGKAVMIRIEKLSNGTFKAQWIGGDDWEEKAIKDDWDFTKEEEDENYFKPFSEEVKTKYAGNGIELKLVRNGGVVCAYVNKQFVGEQVLPKEYAGQKCRVSLAAARVKGGAEIPFSISKEIPASETEKFESALTFNEEDLNLPDDMGATIDKESGYKRGDLITLTLTPKTAEAADKYVVKTLTFGGESILKDYADGKVSFMLTEKTAQALSIELEEAHYVQGLTDISVVGKKYDEKGNTLEGKEVTLKGWGGRKDITFTVQGGKFSTSERVAYGTYTAEIEGYKPVEVEVDGTGIKGGSITFEYDGFESLYWGWDWDKVVLDKANEGKLEFNSKEEFEKGKTFSVKTKDFYDDVAATLVFKQSNSLNEDAYLQGIEFEFSDGKIAMFGINLDEGKVQFRPCPNGWGNKESVWGKPAGNDFWVDLYLTEAEKTAFKSEDGLPITLVRKEGKLYVLIQQDSQGTVRCANVTELPAAYKTAKAQIGFYAADGKKGAIFNYDITTELPSLASTVQINKTPSTSPAGVTISADKETCTLGDTITLTVICPDGYILKELSVNGKDLGGKLHEDRVTFTADRANMEVVFEVIEGEKKQVEVNVKGIDLGNEEISLDGKELTLRLKETSQCYYATVEYDKINTRLPAGTYIVSLDGYYDAEVTVSVESTTVDDIALSRIIFKYNIINEHEKNIFGKDQPVLIAGDGSEAATRSVIKSVKDGKIYEWTVDKFGDIAFTVTLKSGHGNQGIVLRSGWQKDVRVRIEGNKVQWQGGSWWWGTNCIHGDRWDFGNGGEFVNPLSGDLLKKYNGEGLDLTLARKGGTVYALVDGKIYGMQSIDEWANEQIMFAYFAEDAKANYEIPFRFENVDTVLQKAIVAVGTDLAAYKGTWMEEDNTLKVSGTGYAEFKAEAGTRKETVTMKLSGANGGDQGFMYRFSDGKYIAVRYQKNNGNYKVQYTMDTVLCYDESLKNWSDFFMNSDEKSAFDTTGIELKFVRDGKEFKVYLGERLLDTTTLEDKYADMDGVMGIMVWEGKDVAFDYSHTTGDATAPEVTSDAGGEGGTTTPTEGGEA